MEAYLNALTVTELRKSYKVIGRYKMNKAELVQKIMEQKKEIPNYNAFKNVFKNLPIDTLFEYYNNPPFSYFKTLATEEFNTRVDFKQLSKNQYKKLTINFIRDFQHRVCWEKISLYRNLTERFIREFKTRVDWHNISIQQTLSESFIREFQHLVCWWRISQHQNLSIGFIREFQNKIDWLWLSSNKKLSENVFREFQDEIEWDILVVQVKLSEDFIREFRGKFSYLQISIHQTHLSPIFLRELNKPYSPLITNENCYICFDSNETMVKTDACNHICCELCIDTWLIEHSTCPFCRTELF